MGILALNTTNKTNLAEFVTTSNDFFNGLSDIIEKTEKKQLPDSSSLTQTLASLTTYAGYFYKTYSNQLGVLGAGFTLLNLEDDNDKLREAINRNDTENIIIHGLSVVSDVANIIAAIPIPQVKGAAIGISASATLIKEAFKNREKIAKSLKKLSNELFLFVKRLKYDPNVYLSLPNSAIRCHVVNGLNMNRGPMYQGIFSQNRLHPHIFQPQTSNQQRAATLSPLATESNELHRKFKQAYPHYNAASAYLRPDFEWRANERRP